MDTVPTKITLTRQIGFTREAAVTLEDLAQALDRDPRELAAELLCRAIAEEARAVTQGARG